MRSTGLCPAADFWLGKSKPRPGHACLEGEGSGVWGCGGRGGGAAQGMSSVL
jgi:hypothetical protein